MILVLHIAIALLGIGCATFGYIRPTRKNVQASYILAGLTFVSGFYLVLSEPAQMMHACMSGLAYLAVVSAGIVLAQKKLAVLESA